MDYFITGGTGFIGRYLIERLLKREGTVHVLVREGSRGRLEEIRAGWGEDGERVVPVVGEVNTAISTVSETLPFFDLWPFRYATSYELEEGCEPKRPTDEGFYDCYEPVGDFPEVNLSLKAIYARIITAFGVALAPIL